MQIPNTSLIPDPESQTSCDEGRRPLIALKFEKYVPEIATMIQHNSESTRTKGRHNIAPMK